MVQTLIKMKEHKAKEKGVAITDVEDSSRIVRPIRDQGDFQAQADAELAQRIHKEELAELERAQQERQRQEDATNAALAKEFDEIQARIDADHKLAVRLTHEEQEKYTIEERARLLTEFFDQRKKQLVAARAEAIRNKPPIKTQVRIRMITYLKHMGKYTHQQLKNKTYEEIQRLYEKEKRWIDDFQPMDTKAIKDSEKKVDSSSKPVRGKEQESAKSDEEAAADYEHEKEELRMWLTVVSDEEETVDLMILSAKYPIVDWESQNLGSVDMEDLHVYKIIRADGNTSYHKSLSSMLKKFDRQDLVDLHRLVMKRFEDTTPEVIQDSLDDEEDTRSSYEYLNDLEEEYQARALLAKSKRFFKNGKNKGLIAETYDWDDEEVSSDENEVTEVKALTALTDEEKVSIGKESARNGDWTKISMKKHVNTEILKENQNLKFELKKLTSITETWLNSSNIVNQCINEQIPTQKKKILRIDQLTEYTSSSGFKDPVFVKSSANNSDMSITSSNIPKSSETEDSTLPNQYTDEVPSNDTPLPPLKKLYGAEHIFGPKTFKLILKSKSTIKAETLKGIIKIEPSSAPAGGKSSSASKTYSTLAGKLKIVKMEDDPPLAIHHNGQDESSSRSRPSRPSVSFPSCIYCGYNDHHSNDCLYYSTCEIRGRYDHDTHDHNRIISLRRGINPKNPQHVTKNCKTCGRNVHTISDHNDIEWFRKRETLQAKNVESFKENKNEPSALRSKTPTKSSSVNTPFMPPNMLGPDLNSKAVNEFQYSGMIEQLMNLTTSRPNIQSSTALCAHYLAHSSKYVAPPSINVVRQWFPIIGYGEDVSTKGTKPGAQPGYKKQSSSKQTFLSSKEATKGGSPKEPNGSKLGHSNKRKESSSAMDSNPSHPPVSTPVDPGMHKEDQQATGGPTSLGVTSKERAKPQLNSGMSTFNINEPIYTSSFIIHSESASGNDASIVSIAEADPGNSTPSILYLNNKPSFKDLDSPEDDHVIIIEESNEEENDEIHATKNVKTKDTLVPKSSSPKSSLIQELTNQVLILQSQNHKLELENNKAEAALLKAQPSFPNVEQLKELLVKSLKTKLSNILSTNDFSSSLPTELKDIPSKLNELTGEVQRLKNQVHNLEIELPGELKEIPTKLENFTKTVATVQAKLKTLDALPGLLSRVTKALNKFAQVLVSTSSKAIDKSVPSAGQADTMPAEGGEEHKSSYNLPAFSKKS
ncbi:hypothetical protein Tco_1004085 [Tanacetum coccineum]|uniref:CCHC-type domain-containing protein n=1 Tax=Tanacetum coccineum TaxID=301880 RepID=A0ABQ5FCT2_9ASTR